MKIRVTEGTLGEVFTEAELRQSLWQMMVLPYLNITLSIIYTLFTPAFKCTLQSE